MGLSTQIVLIHSAKRTKDSENLAHKMIFDTISVTLLSISKTFYLVKNDLLSMIVLTYTSAISC